MILFEVFNELLIVNEFEPFENDSRSCICLLVILATLDLKTSWCNSLL